MEQLLQFSHSNYFIDLHYIVVSVCWCCHVFCSAYTWDSDYQLMITFVGMGLVLQVQTVFKFTGRIWVS